MTIVLVSTDFHWSLTLHVHKMAREQNVKHGTMAWRTFTIDTEFEAEDYDPADDGCKSASADELSSSDNENSAPDDEESDFGQECRRCQRIPWQLVNKWDQAEHDTDFIMQSIKDHADEYMQESGLTFLALQKKKPTHLGMWTLASRKSCNKGQGRVRHNSNSIFVFLSVERTPCLYCECSGEGLQLSIVSSMGLTRHSSHLTSNNGMC